MEFDFLINSDKKRFVEIDALRGFAIAAIFLYHSSVYFNFPSTYVEYNDVLIRTDGIVRRFSYYFLFGKMFSIFAFLFGFTFYLQIGGGRRRVTHNSRRFAWRMVLLFAFGIVNSVFFPEGDILVLYSLIGFVMIPFRNLPTAALIIAAVILILIPTQLYQILRLQYDPAYLLPIRNSELFKNDVREALATGDLWKIAKANVLSGVPAGLLWQFENGRIGQAVALFILGILAGRWKIFYNKKFDWRFWLKTTLAFVAAASVVFLLKKSILSSGTDTQLYLLTDGLFQLWLNFLTTWVIISLFILIYHLTRGRQLHPLTYLGKMSLTNYILQSILGAFLFSPVGFGLGNTIGLTGSFFITCTILVLMALFSRYWLKANKQGPLEKIWYKLTWLPK